MKKCILSALAGAAAMFLLLALIANTHNEQAPEEYEHIEEILRTGKCTVCIGTPAHLSFQHSLQR